MDCRLNIKLHKDSGVHFGLLSLRSCWGSKRAGHEQPYAEAHVAQHGVKVCSPTACEEWKPVDNQASEVRDGSLGPRPQLAVVPGSQTDHYLMGLLEPKALSSAASKILDPWIPWGNKRLFGFSLEVLRFRVICSTETDSTQLHWENGSKINTCWERGIRKLNHHLP